MIEKEKVIELLKSIKAGCEDYKHRNVVDQCIDAVSGLEEEGDDCK